MERGHARPDTKGYNAEFAKRSSTSLEKARVLSELHMHSENM
jgi:hypothetical protein